MCEVDRPALFVGERLSEVTSLFGPVYRTRHGPWRLGWWGDSSAHFLIGIYLLPHSVLFLVGSWSTMHMETNTMRFRPAAVRGRHLYGTPLKLNSTAGARGVSLSVFCCFAAPR